MITRRALTAAGLVALAFTLSPRQLLAAPPAGFTIHRKPRSLPPLGFQSGIGQTLSLDDFRGNVVLLNVWATWCAPCRAEMPTLDNLQAKLGGTGFEVLALSVDRGGQDDVAPFYRELGLQHLTVYVDKKETAQSSLGIFGLPTTLLIDDEGRELGRLIGPAEWDSTDMIAFLQSMIGRDEDEGDDLIEEAEKPANNNYRETTS